MKHEFEVIKSTEATNSKVGGFVNTLAVTQTTTRFGVKKTTVHRFMLKTDEQLEVGAKEVIDLNEFNIATYESELVDENTGELRKIRNQWLHEKVQ